MLPIVYWISQILQSDYEHKYINIPVQRKCTDLQYANGFTIILWAEWLILVLGCEEVWLSSCQSRIDWWLFRLTYYRSLLWVLPVNRSISKLKLENCNTIECLCSIHSAYFYSASLHCLFKSTTTQKHSLLQHRHCVGGNLYLMFLKLPLQSANEGGKWQHAQRYYILLGPCKLTINYSINH